MKTRRSWRIAGAALLAALLVGWLGWRWIDGDGNTPSPPETAPASSPPAVADAAGPQPKTADAEDEEGDDENEKESASGVPIHLVRRTPVTAPAPPYGPAYAALEAAARGGDSLAQYRLGLMLYECRDVPAEGKALERDIEKTYSTRSRGGWDVSDPHDEERDLRRRFRDCDGVPGAVRDDYRKWMQAAADAGLVEAQLNLPLHLPEGEYCQFLAECPAAQRAKQEVLQKEAIDYIQKARDAGSASALWTLGAWYSEGEVFDENDIEAYANFRALDEINQAAGQGTRFDRMLGELHDRLRPADLVTAEARVREILSNPNCCVITP